VAHWLILEAMCSLCAKAGSAVWKLSAELVTLLPAEGCSTADMLLLVLLSALPLPVLFLTLRGGALLERLLPTDIETCSTSCPERILALDLSMRSMFCAMCCERLCD
jgi:hypothetical protein